MESVAKSEPAFLTFTSAISVVYLLAILGAAYAGANRLLPARAPRADRLTFVWLVSPRLHIRFIAADAHQVFDALIHFSFEGAFLYCSLFGRQANTSTGFLADLGEFSLPASCPGLIHAPTVKEYALADYRWGVADPTVVSLEVLTVLGAGPLCLYIALLLVRRDPARHYWLVVLCTAELYGGCVRSP
jgi:hypothetical protein